MIRKCVAHVSQSSGACQKSGALKRRQRGTKRDRRRFLNTVIMTSHGQTGGFSGRDEPFPRLPPAEAADGSAFGSPWSST